MENSTKSEKPSKQKKPVNFKAKYITLGVVVAVLIVAVVLFFIYNNNRDAKAYMTMQTNPEIQVVLDSGNKVVGQVALNSDGEKILAVVSFEGLSAEDAGKLFAQTVTEMDKMSKATSSAETSTAAGKTNVNITITAENSQNYEKLANSVKSTVNKYFSDNGIFAGAVTSLSNDVKKVAENMAISAKDFTGMTTQEILNYTKQSSDELEQMSRDTLAKVQEFYNKTYDTVLGAVDKAFAAADTVLAECKTALDQAKKAYDKAEGAVKDAQKVLYDTAKTAYDNAVEAYNKAKANYNEKKVDFKKQLDTKIAELKAEAKTVYEQAKADAKTAYNTTKETVNTTIENFKAKSAADKKAVQDQIAEFQKSLATPASA